MTSIETSIELKSQLDKIRPISREAELLIMQKFRLDWNYHSNKIEGNSLTYGETKALIMFGLTAQGKPLKDHFEITGHDEAIKWIMDIIHGEYPLTENFIRELHTLLLKEPYEINAITSEGVPTKRRIQVGQYKTSSNHVLTVTGEIFRFATPEETPALMNELINWYRDKSSLPNLNPITLAAEFHYKFIRIHPFDDGNGRTARLLMNFILMKHGYSPVIIKNEDKTNYFFALRQADSGIIDPFLNYIGDNLVRSLKIMISGAQGESIEERDDFDKEIALLEQRMKSISPLVKISKTKQALLTIYDDTVKRVIVSFLQSSENFNRFYQKNQYQLWVDGAAVTGNFDVYERIREYITDDISFAELSYKFKILKLNGIGEVNYEIKLRFRFDLDGYTISNSDKLNSLKLNYGIQLSNEQIDDLIKKEAIKHKNFIENSIKNYSSKDL